MTQTVRRANEKAFSTTEKTERKRLSAAITSPNTARMMEKYLESHGKSQTIFAGEANTTDRTLRRFRRTGKVRRDIFEAIAKAMGTTVEALLKL